MNEISAEVVYSRDLELMTEQIYEAFFQPGAEPRSDMKQFLDLYFPVITVPIRTPAVELADARLAELARAIAPFQTDHPGLFRVVDSLATLFRNTLEQTKDAVRDEDFWKEVIPDLYSGEMWLKPEIRKARREQIMSVRHFRTELHQVFVATLMSAVKAPREVNRDAAALLNLVTDAYLRQTEIGLERLSKKAPATITPSAELETVTDDLRQAELELTNVLTREERLTFRETVARAEERLASR